MKTLLKTHLLSLAFIAYSLILFHYSMSAGFNAAKLTIEPVIIEKTITETEYIEVPVMQEPNYWYMYAEITAYCTENYPHICNNGDSSTTATGTTPTAGRTIAVDPKTIPYGTEVEINGDIYIAEDTGGAINNNRIDIVFDTHQEALSWGRRYILVKVYDDIGEK